MSNWFQTYGFANVDERLLIGAYPLDEEDVKMLSWIGVGRVLNLVEDHEYHPGSRAPVEAALAAHGIQERRLKLADFGRLPAAALERAVLEVLESLEDGLLTYVHCRAGWQRSAAVAAAAIAVRDGLDIDVAMARVRSMKPSADPLPHQREDMRAWWTARTSGTSA